MKNALLCLALLALTAACDSNRTTVSTKNADGLTPAYVLAHIDDLPPAERGTVFAQTMRRQIAENPTGAYHDLRRTLEDKEQPEAIVRTLLGEAHAAFVTQDPSLAILECEEKDISPRCDVELIRTALVSAASSDPQEFYEAAGYVKRLTSSLQTAVAGDPVAARLIDYSVRKGELETSFGASSAVQRERMEAVTPYAAVKGMTADDLERLALDPKAVFMAIDELQARAAFGSNVDTGKIERVRTGAHEEYQQASYAEHVENVKRRE